MFKSPAEIALMQRANDITSLAYKAEFATLKAGMTQYGARQNVTRRSTGSAAATPGAGFGEYSAFPHGSMQPQKLEPGDIVLVDAGARWRATRQTSRARRCSAADSRQTEVWNLERARRTPRSPRRRSARRVRRSTRRRAR